MPLSEEKYYTSEDYWNLPEGQRAELIDGKLYNMALPDRMHQELVFQLSRIIGNFIESNHGECKIYPAPFAVNLNADNQKWLEPDISIICDRKNFLTADVRALPISLLKWCRLEAAKQIILPKTLFTPMPVYANTGLLTPKSPVPLSTVMRKMPHQLLSHLSSQSRSEYTKI